MKRYWVIGIFMIVLIHFSPIAFSQTKAQLKLEQHIYLLNNQFKYDSSIIILNQYLGNDSANQEDKYYAHLYLSYTYKRLFDYVSTLKNLDKAFEFVSLSKKHQQFQNNIKCQKALVYFDLHYYDKADTLMRALAAENYKYLNQEYIAKMNMQEGFLLYQKRDYENAKSKYKQSLQLLAIASPCDQPMVFGKQIQLYGETNELQELQKTYHVAIALADSCSILKYKIYINNMMMKTFEQRNDFKNAYHYYKIYDSLNLKYNETENLTHAMQLDKKYQAAYKDKEILLKNRSLTKAKTNILLLLIGIVLLTFIFLSYLLYQKNRRLQIKQESDIYYTQLLLQNTEDERRRIAYDLHDVLGHELLNLKKIDFSEPEKINKKIDQLLEEVRTTSRNLHPVMFETIGLQISIEQLAITYHKSHQLLITCSINYVPNRLNVQEELQLYRIVQESLNNITKYANAIAAHVKLNSTNKHITLDVIDNGIGFNVEKVKTSGNAFGLFSIAQRSKFLKAEHTIVSSEKGTIIHVKIPINNA